MDDFVVAFNSAMSSGYSFVFSCLCEVMYDGRAESYLPRGERIVLVKNDKTLLVHQPSGSMPVNHMRMGGVHYLEKSGDSLILRSDHVKNKECLTIIIHDLHFFRTQKLLDGKKVLTKGTEKDMSLMLYKNPSMVCEGFKPLSQEEHTKFGFIDVFGYDKNNVLVVVECKRQKGNLQAVTQLRRYVERIKVAKGLKEVRGILACPSISSNAKDMLLEWGYEWVSVDPPRFDKVRNKDQTELHHHY